MTVDFKNCGNNNNVKVVISLIGEVENAPHNLLTEKFLLKLCSLPLLIFCLYELRRRDKGLENGIKESCGIRGDGCGHEEERIEEEGKWRLSSCK